MKYIVAIVIAVTVILTAHFATALSLLEYTVPEGIGFPSGWTNNPGTATGYLGGVFTVNQTTELAYGIFATGTAAYEPTKAYLFETFASGSYAAWFDETSLLSEADISTSSGEGIATFSPAPILDPNTYYVLAVDDEGGDYTAQYSPTFNGDEERTFYTMVGWANGNTATTSPIDAYNKIFWEVSGLALRNVENGTGTRIVSMTPENGASIAADELTGTYPVEFEFYIYKAPGDEYNTLEFWAELIDAEGLTDEDQYLSIQLPIETDGYQTLSFDGTLSVSGTYMWWAAISKTDAEGNQYLIPSAIGSGNRLLYASSSPITRSIADAIGNIPGIKTACADVDGTWGKGICEAVGALFIPGTTSITYLNTSIKIAERTFPFSLIIGTLNSLRSVNSVTALSAEIPFPWNSSSSFISISSTSMSDVVGSTATNLWLNTLSGFIWLLTAMGAIKIVGLI